MGEKSFLLGRWFFDPELVIVVNGGSEIHNNGANLLLQWGRRNKRELENDFKKED